MHETPIWLMEIGDGPLVACALHDGHYVRPEVAVCLNLTELQRRRQEDPYTAEWTSLAPTRIIARRSRFELDLNCPRDKAVYVAPSEAWGPDVWKCTPSAAVVQHSLQVYDAFYAHLKLLLTRLVSLHGEVVVFDLHTHHCLPGGSSQQHKTDLTPDVRLDTGTMARALWSPIVDSWLHAVREFDFLGRELKVRENVKSSGGQLPRWIHENFSNSVCVLAISVKSFFQEEKTGEPIAQEYRAIGKALDYSAAAVSRELLKVKGDPVVN